MASEGTASGLIIACAIIALVFAFLQFQQIRKIRCERAMPALGMPLEVPRCGPYALCCSNFGVVLAWFRFGENRRVYNPNETNQPFLADANPKLYEIYNAISVGANSFLNAEYTICAYFTVIFGILVRQLLCAARFAVSLCWRHFLARVACVRKAWRP